MIRAFLAVAAVVAWPAGDAGVAGSSPRDDAPTASVVGDLLQRYAAGEYDAALQGVRNLPAGNSSSGRDPLGSVLDSVFLDFRTAATNWIDKGDSAGAPHRRLIAAAFAVELAHARAAVSWTYRRPLIVWACEQIRRESRHLAGERAWHLAAIATLEEADDWGRVAGTKAPDRVGYTNAQAPHFFSRADQDEFRQGHLAHGRAAFPDEPRFRLAEVEYLERQTALASGSGPLGINGQETSPDTLEMLQQVIERRPPDDDAKKIDPKSALSILDRVNHIPAVITEYTGLASDDRVRGDVELHLGFLHLRLEHWDEALAHLAQVPRFTTEPPVIALSHQFNGWIFEHTERRDEAIAEYREALRLMPGARSTSILLAAQLALTGRQGDGYVLLDAALRARPAPAGMSFVYLYLANGPGSTATALTDDAPADPWALYLRGDALILPTLIKRMREGLK
jgi:tetratricopeptide (TPR) repeat protein